MPLNIKWDMTGFVNATDVGLPLAQSFDVTLTDGRVVTVEQVQVLKNTAGGIVAWDYVGGAGARVLVLNK
jgi:hypothetical protein